MPAIINFVQSQELLLVHPIVLQKLNKEKFTISKLCRSFSVIAIDFAHNKDNHTGQWTRVKQLEFLKTYNITSLANYWA